MRKLLMISLITTAMGSTAFAQGQPGGGWWDGWGNGPGNGWWSGGPGMMAPGYGGGPGWGGGPGTGPGWGFPGWGQGMMPPGMGMGMGSMGMGMPAMDADQDGVISAEEAAAHAEVMFVAMDADQDGVLVAEEIGGGRMDMMRRMNPARSAAMQERHAARFAAMDADGDGKVTMIEFLAAEKAQYDAADTDGDGKVTPWELRGQMWK
ncbi:hypothetical protein [Tabrizicola sp.]|uniref:hypothetical protein n=1 Tax=Tabrizicola sp. TaxID=2005166 RepID=UPI00262C1791|nr:hypothetical protein [Tabrizicola sp.]MDM7932831.1 hypothetical protein [Tabrizicola sp.]